MSLYLLDTDICSYIMKRSQPKLLQKLQTINVDTLFISVITEAELLYGMKLASNPRTVYESYEGFIRHVRVLEWNRTAAEHYADIRADLHKRCELIGANDLMIAAQARGLPAILVTNNEKEFKRVKRLKVENWVRN